MKEEFSLCGRCLKQRIQVPFLRWSINNKTLFPRHLHFFPLEVSLVTASFVGLINYFTKGTILPLDWNAALNMLCQRKI